MGGSRISFRRGCTRLMLYFNTNKTHSFFFFCRIPVVLENRRSSKGGGGGGGGPPPPPPTPSTLPLDPPLVFHLFCRWRPVARASYQPRNAAVLKRKAQSAKNFRHWCFGLSNSCWTLFVRSSPRSLPFPHILLHNSLKQLCWICLVALRWKHYNLNIWRLVYQRIVVLHVNNSLQVVFAAKLIFGDDTSFFSEKYLICFS